MRSVNSGQILAENPLQAADEGAVLREILEGTAKETGERFFAALVENLAKALGTYGAWLTIWHGERRLRAVAFWLGGQFVDNYEYDLAGNMTSQTYPSGRKVKTNYDDAGRIAGIKNDATGAYYAGAPSADIPNRIQYSASGAVQVMKLGNGLWEHTNFNLRRQATQIGLGSASTNSSILPLDYDYGSTSNNGNVLTQTITVPWQAKRFFWSESG